MKIFDEDKLTQEQPNNTTNQTNDTSMPVEDTSKPTETPNTQPQQSNIEPIDLTIFTKTDEIIKPVEKVYFKAAQKRAKSAFNIDKTAFAPTRLTLVTRPFNNAYYQQLVCEILMNRKRHEEINIDFILNALVFYERINENKYPIYIKSGKYPGLVEDMVYALNRVYNEYMPVISGIYQMFNSKIG
jgi:hypothetical protein